MPASKDNKDDLGAAEVQAKFDEANDKGYFGELPKQDKSFEDYTLKAVAAGRTK